MRIHKVSITLNEYWVLLILLFHELISKLEMMWIVRGFVSAARSIRPDLLIFVSLPNITTTYALLPSVELSLFLIVTAMFCTLY